MDITTNRLRIRDLVPADLEAMVDLWADDEVERWMSGYGPRSREEVEAWLPATIAYNDARPRDSYNCAIIEQVSGEVIGWVGFGPAGGPSAEPGELNFGYALRRAFRGRGHGTEALRAVLEFCLEGLGAPAFSGETAIGNVASARVMEKVGLIRVGVTDEGQIAFRVAV